MIPSCVSAPTTGCARKRSPRQVRALGDQPGATPTLAARTAESVSVADPRCARTLTTLGARSARSITTSLPYLGELYALIPCQPRRGTPIPWDLAARSTGPGSLARRTVPMRLHGATQSVAMRSSSTSVCISSLASVAPKSLRRRARDRDLGRLSCGDQRRVPPPVVFFGGCGKTSVTPGSARLDGVLALSGVVECRRG